jgi:hypothetical protein
VQYFIKCFVREGPGVWSCVAPAEVMLPQGRVQVTPGTRFTRGSMFMGVEVAKLLDEQYDIDQRRR